MPIAVVLLGTLALQAILSFFSTNWFYQCGESALVDLRRETFRKLIGQPMSFFARRRVGELSSRLTTDITLIQDTLTTTIPQFLRQSMLMTGGIVLVALTSIRLTGLMISTFPVLILVAILFGRRIRRYARAAQDRLADGATVLEESLQGIANVKAFGNERFELARYGDCLPAVSECDPEDCAAAGVNGVLHHLRHLRLHCARLLVWRPPDGGSRVDVR